MSDPFTIKQAVDLASKTTSSEIPAFKIENKNTDVVFDREQGKPLTPLTRDIPSFQNPDVIGEEKNIPKCNVEKSREEAPLQDVTTINNSEGIAKNAISDSKETYNSEIEQPEQELQELTDDYINDIVENSEVPDTIDTGKASSSDFKKCPSEETAVKRDEFNQNKNDLVKQWEDANGQEWPTYKEDVYSANGNLIRRVGDKYDAHHIQPLSMGGKNESSNITPLHAECHYDRQGVHSPNSPYAKLEQKLGE